MGSGAAVEDPAIDLAVWLLKSLIDQIHHQVVRVGSLVYDPLLQILHSHRKLRLLFLVFQCPCLFVLASYVIFDHGGDFDEGQRVLLGDELADLRLPASGRTQQDDSGRPPGRVGLDKFQQAGDVF